jgi:membrane protease YdiL (CAAX protease family)
LIAALALVLYLPLVRWDRVSLGLTAVPEQGWGYWCRLGAVLGLALAGLMAVGVGVRWALGVGPQVIPLDPDSWGEEIALSCLVAPPIEEFVFRLAVCVPAVVVLRERGAIAVSGLLFGLAHIVSGVWSTNHFLAGFFLAWAYLRSGSIVVPIAFHGLGNLGVLGMQIGAWCWSHGWPA